MVYTKQELAKKSGLSRATVSEILNHRQINPKLRTLEKLASALDCSVDELRMKILKKEVL